MAQKPYEFLARWDHITGALKGTHVKTYDTETRVEGDAQSVAVAYAAGYPLIDVLTAVEIGAVIAADELREQLAAANDEIARLREQLAAFQ